MKLERYITLGEKVWINFYNEYGTPCYKCLGENVFYEFFENTEFHHVNERRTLEDMMELDLLNGRKIVTDPKLVNKFLMSQELLK